MEAGMKFHLKQDFSFLDVFLHWLKNKEHNYSQHFSYLWNISFNFCMEVSLSWEPALWKGAALDRKQIPNQKFQMHTSVHTHTHTGNDAILGLRCY